MICLITHVPVQAEVEEDVEFMSAAEKRAHAATKSEAFPVQLYEVRRTVKSLMDLFGRGNIFSEYTVHNFSHVEAMLDDLEWIIPEGAKTKLTPADWLLITLAVYFHDLGLIVTEEEYQNRDSSLFGSFCEKVLFSRDDGQDYRAKVEALGEDLASRFMYQEFVRYNHGERVKAWIEGSIDPKLGDARVAAREINELLARLSPEFRQDLSLVCESHNLDDLEDLKKYKPFKPYGRAQCEAANLLYAAVILRTVDLLQITRQRAPSIMFRMINPTDPISQIEWAKQNAVTGVFPRPAKDNNGIVDATMQSSEISVHAKFHNANGFFGLTSYLSYAQRQIAYSRECVEKANVGIANKLSFPWCHIDDSEVEAVGFIPHPFEFKIDQTRILDLLTGHTLYNESTVAIRELVQNSLDAIRVNQFDKQISCPSYFGSIRIEWNSSELELSILDDGTGMTQDIIERHLLNVGSSRYQDPIFKEEYKDFSPISRFGIGVLSTFMVADDVRIVTFHEAESEGREISLRSVHGKYLIRLLSKETSVESREIGPHGTKITLRFRSSARRVNVVRTLQRWIVFPGCSVTVSVDQCEPISIGFKTPKEALQNYVSNNPELGLAGRDVECHQYESEGITIAYATTYSRHYRDSSFLEYSDSMRRAREISPTGICIEGVRVEFDPPGFTGPKGLLSIANCRGKNAPKTNVARTSLESENDKDNLRKLAIKIYMRQIQFEINRMQSKEGYSLSYAVEQFPFIGGQLFSSKNLSDDEIRFDAAWEFPMFILETEECREVVSANYLKEFGGFWTIESQTMSSLIALLRDSPPNVTCRQISNASQFKGEPLPIGGVVVNSYLGSVAAQLIKGRFEIKELRGSVGDRRLDVRWEPMASGPAWVSVEAFEEAADRIERSKVSQVRKYGVDRQHRARVPRVHVPHGEVRVIGLDQYCCVNLRGEIYMFPHTAVGEFISGLDVNESECRSQVIVYTDALFSNSNHGLSCANVEYTLKEITARYELGKWDISGFLDAVRETEDRLQVFDPWSWQRQENTQSGVGWIDTD